MIRKLSEGTRSFNHSQTCPHPGEQMDLSERLERVATGRVWAELTKGVCEFRVENIKFVIAWAAAGYRVADSGTETRGGAKEVVLSRFKAWVRLRRSERSTFRAFRRPHAHEASEHRNHHATASSATITRVSGNTHSFCLPFALGRRRNVTPLLRPVCSDHYHIGMFRDPVGSSNFSGPTAQAE